MFPLKRVVLLLGVALAFALTALPCRAATASGGTSGPRSNEERAHSLHDFDDISEEDSRKLAEVLAGAPKLDFPADEGMPVDDSSACKPPLLGDANPNGADCDPMLSAKPKASAVTSNPKVREAKRVQQVGAPTKPATRKL